MCKYVLATGRISGSLDELFPGCQLLVSIDSTIHPAAQECGLITVARLPRREAGLISKALFGPMVDHPPQKVYYSAKHASYHAYTLQCAHYFGRPCRSVVHRRRGRSLRLWSWSVGIWAATIGMFGLRGEA